MFERRLKLLLGLLLVPLVLIAARLLQLQLVRAAEYREAAERMLYRKPVMIPFLRGRILDRNDVVLAHDSAAWDIGVHYAFMDDDEQRRRRALKQWDLEPSESPDERIQDAWRRISELTGVTEDRIRTRVEYIVRKTTAIKAYLADFHGVEDWEVQEEWQFWPVVRALDHDQRVSARVQLADCPWVKVIPGKERHYEGGEAVRPVLGFLLDLPDGFMKDPDMEDELARYEASDRIGVSGAEKLGEQWLRGRRGREHVDREGTTLSEPVEPIDGRDMRLAIDVDLQRRVYDHLRGAVARHSLRTGASAVIIHIPTREARALVSYPAYESDTSYVEWMDLAEDPLRRADLFRPVRMPYPPGSIVKPIILAGALADRNVGAGTTFLCEGILPDFAPPRSCLGHHGQVHATDAIRRSCNIYFYRVAGMMGIERIAWWMDKFGFGTASGTGLSERTGNVPTRGSAGTARNMAIGQGAVNVTPVQAANAFATLASGEYRPVILWLDASRPHGAERLKIPDRAWRTVREGMYEAANDPRGTAYGAHRATLSESSDFVILGKTGSAEPPLIVTEWEFEFRFPDGHIERATAVNEHSLAKQFPGAEIVSRSIHRTWPRGSRPTHAWFAGYLAPRHRYLQDVRSGELAYAFAVMTEYAGHGGDAAAPVARQIIEDILHPDQEDPDGEGGQG
jgi:cell division protein FtsI/penicillin-binding protein 2